MRVLGLDPGSRVTGWGVVEMERGAYRHLASGVIRAPRGEALYLRLLRMYRGVADVIAEHAPEAVAVEEVFHHPAHPGGALVLGQARGAVLVAVAEAGLPLHAYSPATVKQTLTGYGRAEKAQLARVVSLLLGVELGGPADRADALALAMTHAAHGRLARLGGEAR